MLALAPQRKEASLTVGRGRDRWIRSDFNKRRWGAGARGLGGSFWGTCEPAPRRPRRGRKGEPERRWPRSGHVRSGPPKGTPQAPKSRRPDRATTRLGGGGEAGRR